MTSWALVFPLAVVAKSSFLGMAGSTFGDGGCLVFLYGIEAGVTGLLVDVRGLGCVIIAVTEVLMEMGF